MPIVQQQTFGWSMWWDQEHTSKPLTVQVKNENVFAEVALTGHESSWDQEEDFHIWLSSIAGITQVVSDSGVESWGPIGEHHYKQALYRENMTSITVQLYGETFSADPGGGWVRGRLVLHVWE